MATSVRPLQLRKKDTPIAAFSSNGSITPPASPRSSSGASSLKSASARVACPPLTVYLRALHPYTATPDPNSDAPCLSLQEGSILYVHSVHSSGWADGSLLDGQRGWFPSNYCEPYILSALQDLSGARTALETAICTDNEAKYGAGVADLVASVRGILDRAGCLSRESPLVQTHEHVKRDRKLLLSELSGLANVAKNRASPPGQLGPELLLRSERVVARAGKFVHAVGPLCGLYAAEGAKAASTVPELITTPPVSFDGGVGAGIPELQEVQAGMLSPEPSSQGESQLPTSYSAQIVLNGTHTAFYSFLSAFIGRLQLEQQTQSANTLQDETRGCVQVARSFLAVLESISGHFKHDRQLIVTRDTLYNKISRFVAQSQGLVQVSDGVMFETSKLVASATGIVKAAGDCLARALFVIETQGDFELTPSTHQADVGASLPRDENSSSTLASSCDDRGSKDVQAQVEAMAIPYKLVEPLAPRAEATSVPLTPTFTRDSTNSSSESLASKRQSATSLLDFDAEDFEVATNADGHLTGATLASLIVQLTPQDQAPDPQLTTTFFHTFRLFTKPHTLAILLVSRFAMPAPSPCPENWETRVAIPVRLRVYNVCKHWVECYWRADTDAEALDVLLEFAKGVLSDALPQAGKRLTSLVEGLATLSATGTLTDRPATEGLLRPIMMRGVPHISGGALTDTPIPPPMMSKTQYATLRLALANMTVSEESPSPAATCSLLEFDDLEIARQLTLLESETFCKITPVELIGQEFSKKKGHSLAVHVKAMSAASTDLAGWVADSILAETEQKRRTLVLKHWLKVAERCAQLSNYNTLMAIMSALNSSTIARLKRTWEGLNRNQRGLLDHLRSITDHQRNYALYRARLRQTTTPCLPFLGLYLTDLTFADEGNPNTRPSKLTDRPLINIDKHIKAVKIVFELQKFQVPYRLAPVPELQTYIAACLARIRAGTADHWRRSLILEPRPQGSAMRRESSAASASDADGMSSSGSIRSLKPRLFASWTS
ncbi:ras guanine nucleotide exchange factor domain-containing protein [Protomyces lactucae-debilis]|uniref:Ras guanine nucleotide exchange factor domain-containing protein n=1 Tax=Protomyces lactucae-debilis TaxID=2754530 RepID=A0A1Y2FGL7_PROLT|nr:ras guanine nucleotide exchange factor domain-containing protein [Protomyces lactucae-debilis]ORY83088.1 ras guanine nucleotide exchange factor domain-containing protein [Protomyces lactucae-debilis]